MDRRYEALAEFRHQIRKFLNFSEQAARNAGLEPQQHQALLAIRGTPTGLDSTVGRIAEMLQIQHHTAVELSDRLERNGLVRREKGQVDHRAVILRLTPRGSRLLQRLSLHHETELRSASSKLLRALESVIRLGHSRAIRKHGRKRRTTRRAVRSK
jgi:DNA-binding MarR family transcriptional regulator